MKKFSDFLQINITDIGRGFIITLISTALTFLFTTIQENAIPTLAELKSSLLIGVGAGISYLIKNLLAGAPKEIHVDPAKTIVINEKTKEVITPNKIQVS